MSRLRPSILDIDKYGELVMNSSYDSCRTTHYSAAELSHLLEAANKVCVKEGDEQQPEIVVLRRLSAS